ncbi:hypothetical protein EV356DRAFT_497252 [Viridothelium virens]|uniref:Uncharacterized protein n=1 Tax=Viridothelium virens TaxID=1048519 RepID=A0A6A6HGP4_VIRVR|nr:hypothetical protein EV356DRAFT_497252 [Viridothelium virens]
MKFLNAAATLGFVAGVVAQSQSTITSISDAQATKLVSDLASYQLSVFGNPSVNSLWSVVSSQVPESALESFDPDAAVSSVYGTASVISLGVTPTITPQPWETYLKPSVQTQVDKFFTSVLVAQQSIVNKDLPGSSSTILPNGLGWVLGAIAGGVGVVAVML